jgi:hypothetical protein
MCVHPNVQVALQAIMDPICLLEWLKVLGPFLLAIVVAVATWKFQEWQVRLAKQKLRHDLYDRRFAIYLAFEELLLALPVKGEDEIKAAFQKAVIARLKARFLLADQNTQAYLEALCKEVNDEVIGNFMFLDAFKQDATLKSDPQAVRDSLERGSRLGIAKLKIPDRHLRELSEQFAKFLELTDFWK